MIFIRYNLLCQINYLKFHGDIFGVIISLGMDKAINALVCKEKKIFIPYFTHKEGNILLKCNLFMKLCGEYQPIMLRTWSAKYLDFKLSKNAGAIL